MLYIQYTLSKGIELAYLVLSTSRNNESPMHLYGYLASNGPISQKSP